MSHLHPRYVTTVPDELEDDVLYVSMDFASAQHNCACGCGQPVITPLSPSDWQLSFDGTVSLRPSIGNWQLSCRSHYFIHRNRVVWASDQQPDRVGVTGRIRPPATDAGHDRKVLIPVTIGAGVAALAAVALDLPWAGLLLAAVVSVVLWAVLGRLR